MAKTTGRRRQTPKKARVVGKKAVAKEKTTVVPAIQEAEPEESPAIDAPRMGALSPEDFEAAARDALGGLGWQRSFRSGTGLAQSTLTRYLKGVFPIPQHVAIIVEMLQTLRRNNLPVPDAFISSR